MKSIIIGTVPTRLVRLAGMVIRVNDKFLTEECSYVYQKEELCQLEILSNNFDEYIGK